MSPLVRIKNLSVSYKMGKKRLTAVQDFSLEIHPGEALGLVGESGCGKTTVGKAVLGLISPNTGTISFDGQPLATLSSKEFKQIRKRMQVVFQDPYASLNPRMTVEELISEPLTIHRIQGDKKQRVKDLLKLVDLDPSFVSRFPHEFSGGQRQRIAIARALALNPKFLVLDEPISALDVSVQAQVVNLLKSLQKQMGLTYLFIAHDLAMVKYLCDKVAVMYMGNLVEYGPSEALFSSPKHPYTKALLSSICLPDPVAERKKKRLILQGEVPSPMNLPKGCPFCSRCPMAEPRCSKEKPILQDLPTEHSAACHLL